MMPWQNTVFALDLLAEDRDTLTYAKLYRSTQRHALCRP